MAKKPKEFLEDDDDAATTEWPAIKSYTTEDGFLVKVYQAAYAVAGSNKYSVKPKAATLL